MYQGETITTGIRDLPVPIDCRSEKIVDVEEKKLYQELIELSSINKNHLNVEDDSL